MFGSAVTIMIGAALVFTMPAGPEHDGAQAVIGLLGMGFNIVAIVWGAVWCVRNRKNFRQFIENISEVLK